MGEPMFDPLTDDESGPWVDDRGKGRPNDEWIAITPIPPDAGKAASHPKLGRPAERWCYRDRDGRPHNWPAPG